MVKKQENSPLPRPRKYKKSRYIKYVNLVDKPRKDLMYYLFDENFIEGEVQQYEKGVYNAHLLIHKKTKKKS